MSQLRGPAELHTFELFFTFSHTLPLYDSHLNIGFLNVELQANYSQHYNLALWLFRDKTLKQTPDLTCKLGIVEQNSLTPNSRICVALEP